MTLEGNNGQVMIQSKLSESIRINSGVRKGDALACFFFNVAMEELVRDAEFHMIGAECYKPVQMVAYVGDIVVVDRTLPTMKAAFELLDKGAKKMGLTVNENKKKKLYGC
jgi:hypothetical protein